MVSKSLICRWCGEPFISDEVDWSADKVGFWCPDCDGYTYSDPQKDDRRMLLLLESKQPVLLSEKTIVKPCAIKFPKRLSPLRYPGGKSKVIEQIYNRMKQDCRETFVELFAGGASLGLSLLEAGVIRNLILNELDNAVYNFWSVVLKNHEPLVNMILSSPPTLERFWKAKEHCKEWQARKIDEITAEESILLAYHFLVLNRTAFGGIQMANPLGGKNGSDDLIRQRWNAPNLEKRIQRIAALSSNITLHHKDARVLLEEEIGWMSEKTTVFIDPPYTDVGHSLYPEAFTDGHEGLAELVESFYRSYPGPDIMITYNDCERVRDLYPDAEVELLSTSWSIYRSEQKTG